MNQAQVVQHYKESMQIPRRTFLQSSTSLAGALAVGRFPSASLPAGNMLAPPVALAPAPLATPHFPARLYAFVWRNWSLVPVEKMAPTGAAGPEQIRSSAKCTGLPASPLITLQQQR